MKNKTLIGLLMASALLLSGCNNPQPSSSSAPTSDPSSGDTSSETSGDASSETSGDTSSETSGDTSGETSGDTSSETSGDTSGETTSETSGDTSSETSGDTSSETSGDTSSETSGDTSSESTSEEQGPTFDEVVAEFLTKAATMRGKITVSGYKETEYLGANIAHVKYIGNYASNGEQLYFTTEQGGFVYTRAQGATDFEFKQYDEDVTNIHSAYFYSLYNVVDANFLTNIALTGQTEDTFVAEFDLSTENPNATNHKAAFIGLIGYTPSSSNVNKLTKATFTIAKDLSSVVCDVTYNGSPDGFTVTGVGTQTNEEIETFVAGLPPYEPPVVPEGFTTAINKLIADSKLAHRGLVVVDAWATMKYLGDFVYYVDNVYFEYQMLEFNHEGVGYSYIDEGAGFELDDQQEGGYTYDTMYSIFDIIDDNFAKAATYIDEDDDSYNGELNMAQLSTYAPTAFSVLSGWGTSGYASSATFELAKDGSKIDIKAKIGNSTESFHISNLGTYTDSTVDALIDGILNPPALTEWTDEVVEALGEEIAAELPVPANVTSVYNIFEDSFGIDVEIMLKTNGDAEEIAGAYCAELKKTWNEIENVHEYGDDYAYVAPSGKFEVVAYDYNDVLCIDVYFAGETPVDPGEEEEDPTFPSETLAGYLVDLGIETTIPAMEGTFKDVDIEKTSERIEIDLLLKTNVEEDAIDEFDAYISLLISATYGFEVVDYDSDMASGLIEYLELTNGKADLVMKLLETNNGYVVYMMIKATPATPEETVAFPVDFIKEKTGYTGALPTIEGAVKIEQSFDDPAVDVYVYFETEAEAEAALAQFNSDLVNNCGFVAHNIYDFYPGFISQDDFCATDYGINEDAETGYYCLILSFFYE